MIERWVTRHEPHKINLRILEESALALAQSTIYSAMEAAGFSRSDLARELNRPRSFVTRLLKGDHNLTVKTLSRVLAGCGFELEIQAVPLRWSWSDETYEQHSLDLEVPPTGGLAAQAA